MWRMKRDLERKLGLPASDFSSIFKELGDD